MTLKRRAVVPSPFSPSPPRPAKGKTTSSALSSDSNTDSTNPRARLKIDRTRGDHPSPDPQIREDTWPAAATSGLAEMWIELQPSYFDATPPPPS
jgi:hypothetical protein